MGPSSASDLINPRGCFSHRPIPDLKNRSTSLGHRWLGFQMQNNIRNAYLSVKLNIWVWIKSDQYLLIPFLGGWTSIYQLFWGSLGTRVLTHPHISVSRALTRLTSSLLHRSDAVWCHSGPRWVLPAAALCGIWRLRTDVTMWPCDLIAMWIHRTHAQVKEPCHWLVWIVAKNGWFQKFRTRNGFSLTNLSDLQWNI